MPSNASLRFEPGKWFNSCRKFQKLIDENSSVRCSGLIHCREQDTEQTGCHAMYRNMDKSTKRFIQRRTQMRTDERLPNEYSQAGAPTSHASSLKMRNIRFFSRQEHKTKKSQLAFALWPSVQETPHLCTHPRAYQMYPSRAGFSRIQLVSLFG